MASILPSVLPFERFEFLNIRRRFLEHAARIMRKEHSYSALFKHVLTHIEHTVAESQRTPQPKSRREMVQKLSRYLRNQPMLLTVNDNAEGGVEMLYVFLQAAGFPGSNMFYRMLHYAGVDVLSVLKAKHATCQVTASAACVLWLIATKQKEALLQAIFDMYDQSEQAMLSQQEAAVLLHDLVYIGNPSVAQSNSEILVAELLQQLKEYGSVLQQCCSPSSLDNDTAFPTLSDAAAEQTVCQAMSRAQNLENEEDEPIQREVLTRFLSKKRPSLVMSATSLQKQLHNWVENVSQCDIEECLASEAGCDHATTTTAKNLRTETIELLEEMGYVRARRVSTDRHVARRASETQTLTKAEASCLDRVKRISSSFISRFRRRRSSRCFPLASE